MKKEIWKTVVLIIICVAGGFLIGFNAGKLSSLVNIILFVVGILLVSMSTAILGLLEKLFNKKDKNNKEENR